MLCTKCAHVLLIKRFLICMQRDQCSLKRCARHKLLTAYLIWLGWYGIPPLVSHSFSNLSSGSPGTSISVSPSACRTPHSRDVTSVEHSRDVSSAQSWRQYIQHSQNVIIQQYSDMASGLTVSYTLYMYMYMYMYITVWWYMYVHVYGMYLGRDERKYFTCA